MYETEVNNSIESIETLPTEIRERFAEFRDRIAARTVLPWGEHCTECAWPTCYTTCDLYSPRQDGACRQFTDGVVRIDHKTGTNPYLLKIRFKQWAKFWTVGNLNLRTFSAAVRHEQFNIAVGALGRNMPVPGVIKTKILQKINYARRLSGENAPPSVELPDYFMLECFNPNPRTITLTFTVRLRFEKEVPPFQTMIEVAEGYSCSKILFSDMSRTIGGQLPFEVEIIPNDCENTVLYFGLMDFVREKPQVKKEKLEIKPEKTASNAPRPLKCIVWDLDNTLWDGILIEDGPEKIRVRPGVVDLIKRTDQSGILHSIASKNNYDDAMNVLRAHSLDQYFLYPQIKWQPKSQSLAEIAQRINIGIDTLAFIDDQQFEREEVKASAPDVAVIDALDYADILSRPECAAEATEESRNRRRSYQEQQEREAVLDSFSGDYLHFLRECQLQVTMRPLDGTNLQRVYELAQRTNQMNFSGKRYQIAELKELIDAAYFETYVIDCKDRFGNYGIVGFAVVDARVPRLLDLMFSCRVQAKRVEHAVLTFLLKRSVDRGMDFQADYRRTPKNAASGKVFEEMGFESMAEEDGISRLIFQRGKEIPDDQVVNIEALGKALA
jgi:FkbH-like protein